MITMNLTAEKIASLTGGEIVHKADDDGLGLGFENSAGHRMCPELKALVRKTDIRLILHPQISLARGRLEACRNC